MNASCSIPWPLAVVDFEASSLEVDSYPVEVGIAVWRAIDQPVATWSSLIRPIRDWCVHGHWSRKSQKVHGIRGDELAVAPEANAVVEELCARLESITTVWCDGGPYDVYWNARLFAAANRTCTFRLGDWHRMLLGLPDGVREAVLSRARQMGQKHRAGEDAANLAAILKDVLS